MFMTTNKLPKSKKYILTILKKENMSSGFEEIQLGKFDSLNECAEFIVYKNESWYNCLYGSINMNSKLKPIILQLKRLVADF